MPAWLAILTRSVVIFFLTMVLVRLLGKRQPARLDSFQFVNYLILAIIAALTALYVVPNLAFGVMALLVWALLPIGLDWLAIKSKSIHDLLHGKETILIKQGKIMEENLFRARLTGQELLRELRSKNAFHVGDVEFAMMETNGDLNVLLKSDRMPITPHDLGQRVAPRTEPQTVIIDGNILDEPLSSLGLNREWLGLELDKLGVPLNNVFLAQIDGYGKLFLDLFDDAVRLPRPRVKEMLYANLLKCQADLTTFALETADPDAKTMYSRNAAKLEQLLDKLKPYLLR
jgi:uncharacterized membrane protein YcaP (DUF421 family)